MIMSCDFQQESQFKKKMGEKCMAWLQRKEEETKGEKNKPILFSLFKRPDM